MTWLALGGHQRAWLTAAIAMMLALAAGLSGLPAPDPTDAWLRVAMVLLACGAALWLPWETLMLVILLSWFVPHLARSLLGGPALLRIETMLELGGLVVFGGAGMLARRAFASLEEENVLLQTMVNELNETDGETGAYNERLLAGAIEAELMRSRRFGHRFALMFAGIDSITQRFDYRDAAQLGAGLRATAGVLLNTRKHVDRVFRRGATGFALLLPESGSEDIGGLIRRLNRAARKASPAAGEPGGPLPLHFGVTFFPACATTVEDLVRRADIALRLAERSPNGIQLDSAEAPEMPSPEVLRQDPDAEGALDLDPAETAGWPSTAVSPHGVPAIQVPPATAEAFACLSSDLHQTLQVITELRRRRARPVSDEETLATA